MKPLVDWYNASIKETGEIYDSKTNSKTKDEGNKIFSL